MCFYVKVNARILSLTRLPCQVLELMEIVKGQVVSLDTGVVPIAVYENGAFRSLSSK